MATALLGLGEAGALYARGLLDTGETVTGYDPADVPTPDGVERSPDIASAVAGADVVLGLTGARHAESATRTAVAAMEPGAVLLEMNSAAPSFKRTLDALVAQRGDLSFADVAVVGSVPQSGARTAVVVSGSGSRRAAEFFDRLGAPVEALEAPAGAAAQRKLLRSVFMKGLGAIIVEALEAGAAADDLEWVRGQVAGQLTGGSEWMDRLAAGTLKHGARRGHEMQAAAGMLRDLGLTPTMATASADLHLGLARSSTRLEDSLLSAYAGLATTLIGDARDRLGLLDSGIRPVWPGARVVGRALPVFCRAGENPAINSALTVARPGDVLVVDGQGDTNRALMGDLIAERAARAGVLGMVVDGAVRDSEELRSMGFPVWSRGVSPAGPYKNGPGWFGRPVAVGGLVVATGDLVVGDADGVAVVPAAEAEATLSTARAIEADEARRRAAMSGVPGTPS